MTTLCIKICDILVNIGYQQYELLHSDADKI